MTTVLRKGLLQAGAAQVDITPRMGTQIAGDIGRRRPAELVQDPLYARALVLESQGRRLCLLSLDLLAVTREWADEIRHQAARQFGLERSAVMIHDTQTHAAPTLGHTFWSENAAYSPPNLPWLRGGDDEYNVYAVPRILEAIRRAQAELEPVSVGAASGIEGRVAYNRRFVMRDGSVKTHPAAGDPRIRYAEGPIDPELGIVCFATESLRIPAMLLHHTCHPVHGYPQRYISAGWPGVWCDAMKEAYGRQCVPLVINGFCGNIHHANHLDPSYVDDYRRMGLLLAEASHPVLKRITYEREVVLDWRATHISIPIRELDPAEVRAAEQFLAQHPEPLWLDEAHTAVHWDWVYAVAMLDLAARRRQDATFDYEVQAFRIGDIAIVGAPGEPFVEGQLRIKVESPTYPTYVAHHCNAYVGYIPTPQALQRGGYETRTANWSMLAPEALDMIADAAVQLLREMF